MTEARKQNNLDLIDGLRRFQDDFNRDFSIRDITPELQDCISKNDLLDFSNLTDDHQKIDKLFFLFIYVKKDVSPLIVRLKRSYRWLYDKIINSKGDKWIHDHRKAIQDIPNNQDWNIHRTKYLWEIQQGLKVLKRNHYLILFGKLGFGKRWLAADACRDYGIINRMNFRIYWLNVSKCCTQELVLEKMHRLKVLLQADDLDIKYNTYSGNTKNEIIHMRNYLRKILEQPEFKECLIVLTDVQDENIVKAFDLKCKIFMTTRHIEKLEYIPSSNKTTLEIHKGFLHQESMELFSKAFNEHLPPDMPNYIEKFHEICNGHPFIMCLIAKTFQNFKESENNRKTRCDKWMKNLSEYKLQDKDNQIKMSVEESLKFLDVRHQICYKKMVIFTDNSDIPFKVLEKIWETDSHQTEEIVLKLTKYSLIEKPISEEYDKACSLHYLHFHFLKQQVPEVEQRNYHRHLIEKYEIEKIIRERKELDLDFPNDNYFYYFIPYHLKGAKMDHLFDLYLDFGFLEQKMRLTLLPNTVGDLIRFEKEITRNEPEREKLLAELIDFLTKSEQLIFKSNDVNLLQCALTSFGSVQEAAQNQMKKFTDRVWMDDVNHEENQTQIVQLTGGSQPQLVRFVKPNDNLVCLISLQDNNILLHDISQDYPDDPVLYRNELSHSMITDMQVFRNHAFLTLNDHGKLSIYTLKHSPTRRVSGPSRVTTSRSLDSPYSKFLHRLEGGADTFTCFNVFEHQTTADKLQIDLMIGTIQGNIKFYQWKANKFEENKKIQIKTGFNHLFRMAHILHDYVLLLNRHGEIQYISLINSGSLAASRPWNPLKSPINLHQSICVHTKSPISLCVSKHKVVQVTHETVRKSPQCVFIEYDDVFMADDEFDNNKILSSTMSKDAEYLILGTTKGIIVINRFNKKVIFRRNVSDQVLSLDIYRYQDEALYILSSVFKDAGHIISLYGFNDNHDELAMMSNEMNFFVGEDLFDIKKSADDWQMVAVDTKRHIHYRLSTDDFTESTGKFEFQFQIKKISCHGEKVIVGCTNGAVLSTDQYNQTTPLATLMSEITYLECFDDAVLASCNCSFKIVDINKEFYGKLTKAYRFKERQLLLVKKNCAIELLDTESKTLTWSKLLVDKASSTAQAYCDGVVAIATTLDTIVIWRVNEEQDANLEIRTIRVNSPVTALALSNDKNVLAVGCFNGVIEVYDQTTTAVLQKLESHKRPIMNLHFSPWTDPHDPLILLSLSESVIFWNIRAIQNNPMDIKRKDVSTTVRVRVSQRFKSPLKIIPTDTKLLTATDNLTLYDTQPNPWRRKAGSSEKPELLSCIKLVAKSAKRIVFNDDFTRFVTIDNEGNVYHLRMMGESADDDNQLTIDFNGNPSPKFQ